MLFFHCGVPQNDWNLVQPPCPRQPVPVFCYSQSKSVSWCSEGASCVSVCAHCHWRDYVFFALSLRFFAYFDKILKNLLFSRLSSLSSLSLLIWEILQSLNHLRGPLLDSLHSVHLSAAGEARTGHNSPGMASSVLNRGERSPLLICWQHSCSGSPGISLICSKGVYGSPSQLGVYQVLPCKAAFLVVDLSMYWCI